MFLCQTIIQWVVHRLMSPSETSPIVELASNLLAVESAERRRQFSFMAKLTLYDMEAS